MWLDLELSGKNNWDFSLKESFLGDFPELILDNRFYQRIYGSGLLLNNPAGGYWMEMVLKYLMKLCTLLALHV